jgi:hypothetical protein
MARRQKHDVSERRTAALNVQLTPTERAELNSRAVKVLGDKPNLSEYARMVLLSETKNPPPSARDQRALRQLRVELIRVGTNLNQLAHVANANNAIPSERVLRDVARQIIEALEKVQAL